MMLGAWCGVHCVWNGGRGQLQRTSEHCSAADVNGKDRVRTQGHVSALLCSWPGACLPRFVLMFPLFSVCD